MFLVVTRNFPPDVGGMQVLMGGLSEGLLNHGPVKVFAYEYENSKIYEKNENSTSINIIADLTIGKGPFKDTFKSDVKFNKNNDHIHVVNIDGPLNYMENNWKFIEIANGNNGYKTEVFFDIDFEVKNKFLNILMTKSFQYGLEKIADAFQKRAESL